MPVKRIILIGVAAICLILGLILLLEPGLRLNDMENIQDSITQQIEAGVSKIELPDVGPLLPLDGSYEEEQGYDSVLIDPVADSPATDRDASRKGVMDGQHGGETGDAGVQPDTVTGIGILEIDKIDAKLPVTEGATVAQLKVSEGWLTQTARIGSVGNAVIAGHRSYQYGRHFNRLGELVIGDDIRYTSIDGEVMTFIVKEIFITDPGDPAVFYEPEAGVAQLTLYTCTPIQTGTQRLVVRAIRK